MNTELLARAMREATADLHAPADLAARSSRGGRRRVRRARLGLTAGLSVVVLLAGVFVAMPRFGVVDWTGDARLEQPTGGDLAGDTTFLADAVTAWHDGMEFSPEASRGLFDDLRGRPKVYWAGSTPSGRAAVLLQRAFLHEHGDLSSDDWNQMQTLVGLVAIDPRDNRLKLVSAQYQTKGGPVPGAFRFGPGDRTVLVVDRGLPLLFSPGPRRLDNGLPVRDWQRLPISDGVAVAQVPEPGSADDAVVFARQSAPVNNRDRAGMLMLEPASTYLEVSDALRTGKTYVFSVAEHRLAWPVGVMALGEQRSTDLGSIATRKTTVPETGLLDIASNYVGIGFWAVVVGLADGRTVVVSEVQEGEHPSRAYGLLYAADGSIVDTYLGGEIDPARVLPVRVRLPQGLGWVVADHGAALEYRTADTGDWLPGGADAAYLPANAGAVRVTRAGTPTIVELQP